jgi:putative Holliday junction resolvase
MVLNLIIITILSFFSSDFSVAFSSPRNIVQDSRVVVANRIRKHASHFTATPGPRFAMMNGEGMSEKLVTAAAELTSETSSLLGVKAIGVDYGLVRTGLAVTCGYEPEAIAIVSDLNNTELSQRIIKIAESEKASQIIVGLPFHKNGTEAEQTIITREFASHLNCATVAHFGPDKMPIYMWDERYTSKEAAARLRAVNPRANLYKELDAEAACIILEYYYEDNGEGAQRVELPDDEKIVEAVYQAWEKRKEEQRQKLKELTDLRMNPQRSRKEIMEKARLLDEKLALENNNTPSKKKKKKKKKKKR